MPTHPRVRRLDVEQVDDVTVIRFTIPSIMEEQDIHAVGEQLYALADDHRPPRLLLNFGAVEHLSSSMIGKLIALNRKVRMAGGQLALSNVNPTVQEIFEVAGLENLFPTFDNEQVALQTF